MESKSPFKALIAAVSMPSVVSKSQAPSAEDTGSGPGRRASITSIDGTAALCIEFQHPDKEALPVIHYADGHTVTPQPTREQAASGGDELRDDDDGAVTCTTLLSALGYTGSASAAAPTHDPKDWCAQGETFSRRGVHKAIDVFAVKQVTPRSVENGIGQADV
jgi:hypothetical protein